jgi:hypothetical protein
VSSGGCSKWSFFLGTYKHFRGLLLRSGAGVRDRLPRVRTAVGGGDGVGEQSEDGGDDRGEVEVHHSGITPGAWVCSVGSYGTCVSTVSSESLYSPHMWGVRVLHPPMIEVVALVGVVV